MKNKKPLTDTGGNISQESMIKEHLSLGYTLTPIEALNKFGCFRLAAVVFDLKEQGMNIKTKIIENNGKRFAEYKAIPKEDLFQ